MSGWIQCDGFDDARANFEADAQLIVAKDLHMGGQRGVVLAAVGGHLHFNAGNLRVESQHLVDLGPNLQVPARRGPLARTMTATTWFS